MNALPYQVKSGSVTNEGGENGYVLATSNLCQFYSTFLDLAVFKLNQHSGHLA